MAATKRVLYAVLNWGLGHATRSIPVINALQKHGFEPVIATDGAAFDFLNQSFPHLQKVEMPALKLSYAKSGSQVWAMLGQTGKLIKWHRSESEFMAAHLTNNNYVGIISDNVPSVHSANIPSVYITHQLQVKAGLTSAMATRAHHTLYQKFTEIWVPDSEGEYALAGALSKKKEDTKTRYVGVLSDLQPVTESEEFDCAAILSGPEPQRSMLEEALIVQLSAQVDRKVIFIRGTQAKRPKGLPTHWQIIDIANRQEIQHAFARSRVIIARNGYSTLMDLEVFPKPALLIPTPGQPEQEYLATLPIHQKRYALHAQAALEAEKGMAEAIQKSVNSKKEKRIEPNWGVLFRLFEGE
jgi:UDP:flavonoid glycosyltransferase YjiC (YdhE family)